MKHTVSSLHPAHRDVRVAHYVGHQALHIVDELVLLEAAGRDVVAGQQSPGAWLEAAIAEPGFHLVTASVGGRLAGFVAATAAEGRLVVRQLTVAPVAVERRPELAGVLVDTLVDVVDLPWMDLVLSQRSPALPHLLERGWLAVPAEPFDVDGRDAITLSAATLAGAEGLSA